MVEFVRARPCAFRTLFALYAAAVLVATHWPRLHVPGAEEGSDKLAHFAAFFLWTLLAFTALFPPAFSRRSLNRAALLAGAYAVLDEASQLIPAVERQAGALDGLANVIGVLAAYALAMIVIRPGSSLPMNLT
jgi:VanZ family protein